MRKSFQNGSACLRTLIGSGLLGMAVMATSLLSPTDARAQGAFKSSIQLFFLTLLLCLSSVSAVAQVALPQTCSTEGIFNTGFTLSDTVVSDPTGTSGSTLSSNIDYVDLQGGPANPAGSIFVNGFDRLGGVGQGLVTFNTAQTYQGTEVVINSYYYDHVSNGPAAFVVNPGITLITSDQGTINATYVLNAAERAALLGQGWIPIQFRFPITGTQVTVTGFNTFLESINGGTVDPFNAMTSEVFAMGITDLCAVPTSITAIAAVDDTPASINGASGGDSSVTVLEGDMLNSVDATLLTVAITVPVAADYTDAVTGDPVTGLTLNPTTGVVTVAAGTPAGTYEVAYEICEQLNSGNCADAVMTVVVTAAAIAAVDDDFSGNPVSTFEGGTTSSVLSNDTINGIAVAADGSQTTLTLLDNGGLTGATIAVDGTISIPAGAPEDSYTLSYQLCEILNPTNCDTATVTIVVSEPSILPLIQADLDEILTDDLVATLTQQGSQMESYAAGALNRLRTRNASSCLADVNARLQVENIRFDTDLAVIKPQSNRMLDEIAQILGTCGGSEFEIAGHTDSDASDAYNIDLSQRRVEAVLAALSVRGVQTVGFVARGYGESQPLASNATEAGKAQNRRVEFRSLDDVQHQNQCSEGNILARNLDGTANDDGASVNGSLLSQSYNCVRDDWTIVEGGLSYLETDAGQSQAMVTLSYRRERFVDENSVRGWFGGLYGSQNDISNLATGEISGFGLNGGVYGADQLNNGVFLDYYLGAAAGRHEFNLDFARDIGAINASGDYTYVAGFAGAALSGELEFGEYTVLPRVGFQYAYSPGGDVDVITELNGVQQSAAFDLDSVSGGLVFLEARNEQLINDGQTLFAFTPRLNCYQSLGSLDGDCSIGGAIEFTEAADDSELGYSLKLEAERGESFTRVSITGSVTRQMRYGVMSGNTALSSEGSLSVGGAVELGF